MDTAAEEQQDLGRVAEWFLFGAPPTDAGEPREPTLQDDGFLGAAKVYADHSRQSLQNFDEGRTAYKLVCIVERLYRCVPSCRRILDVTSAHAMARHTPERQAALIKYSWDWVVEFAKHCSVQRYMGGDDRNCVRNSRSVSIIDSLVRIHNSTGLYPAGKIPPTPFMPGVDYQGACHDSVAKEISNGNTCYVVSGSGSTFCDGEYTLDGYFDSVPKWSKSCVVTLTDKKGRKVEQSMTLTLFRVQMQNKQSRQWYLSKMDPLKPGTNKDVDYYCCSSQTECPPKIGWRKIGNGRDPAPVSVRGNADMARRAELNQRSRGHSVSSDDSSGEEEYRGEEKWHDRSGGGDGRFPAAPSAPRVANICLPGDGVDPYPTVSWRGAEGGG